MPSEGRQFQILEGLPPYGPSALPFPTNGARSHSEGLVVRFTPLVGEPWVGNFQPGVTSYRDVLQHPDGQRAFVISGGQGYIVDPSNHGGAQEIGGAYTDAVALDDSLVLITPCELELHGPEGLRWRTKRISWDGLQSVQVDPIRAVITGEAWSPLDDSWSRFVVDLRTGDVTGGSYAFGD